MSLTTEIISIIQEVEARTKNKPMQWPIADWLIPDTKEIVTPYLIEEGIDPNSITDEHYIKFAMNALQVSHELERLDWND